MRMPQDRVLNLRVPAALRRQLDAAAGGSPRGMSIVARNALALGLAAISPTSGPDDPPPPAAPSAALRVAA